MRGGRFIALVGGLSIFSLTALSAQVAYPPGVSQSDLANMAATIPVAASTLPPVEAPAGAIGAPGTYRPAGAVDVRITRASTVTTDASGNWAVIWSTPLLSTPVTLPIPINSGSQPAICNVTTTTATGATGKCFINQTTVLSLGIVTAGLTLNPTAAAAAGMSVQLLAIPVTQ